MTVTAHPLNRHIFIADNLDLLRKLDNESIDLVCCDPPFAKNQTFEGEVIPPLTEAEIDAEKALLKEWGITSAAKAEAENLMWPYDDDSNKAKFADIWRYKHVIHEDWTMKLEDEWEPVNQAITAALKCHGENMAAYLIYMTMRMIEIHRVLKPTGSFFIHCDWEANSYLRMILDGIFGAKNLRNEIIWKRYRGKRAAKNPRKYAAVTDTVLFYAKSKDSFFNLPFDPLDEEYVAKAYKYDDNDGRGRYRYGGRIPDRKYYLSASRGTPITNIWDDIPELNGKADEMTGYPTQKPVALAERIIRSATNEGDVVLDPFAGCAYVPVAAERNKRQWIACDISIRALTVLKRQFKKFHYKVDDDSSAEEGKLELVSAEITTRSPFDMPKRTDKDPVPVPVAKSLPPTEYKSRSEISSQEMKEILLSVSGWEAWCCGFANRKRNGDVIRTTNNFHLDHIDPKSKGGSNRMVNRAPLCQAHNQTKKNRQITLAQLRDEIEAAGELQVASQSELVNITEAQAEAMEIYYTKHPPEKLTKPELDLQM